MILSMMTGKFWIIGNWCHFTHRACDDEAGTLKKSVTVLYNPSELAHGRQAGMRLREQETQAACPACPPFLGLAAVQLTRPPQCRPPSTPGTPKCNKWQCIPSFKPAACPRRRNPCPHVQAYVSSGVAVPTLTKHPSRKSGRLALACLLFVATFLTLWQPLVQQPSVLLVHSQIQNHKTLDLSNENTLLQHQVVVKLTLKVYSSGSTESPQPPPLSALGCAARGCQRRRPSSFFRP